MALKLKGHNAIATGGKHSVGPVGGGHELRGRVSRSFSVRVAWIRGDGSLS